ncbi:hypothetical protein LTS18_003709 [Coniosporium uncinatum]|uniref:Uncharacterized protein n=1 Tax=Coniosporium uncinatum TaxID=93489 RepID=A0ACC3DBE5_9PEZI|nr:hypothetical protein LTS18_003709 [Coniosporium uncinatum]
MEQLKDSNIRWTITRPCCIWGDALGKPQTLPLFAIICKYLGKELPYPVVDRDALTCHVDGDMLGRVFVWAAESPNAHGQSYNVDNGDVCNFRNLWASLSDFYNIPLAEKDEHFTLAQFFRDHESTWAEIVEKCRLREYTLDQLLGRSAHSVDILLNNCPKDHMIGGGRPWIESRVKLTQAGFTECVDTEDMAFKYFKRMEQDRIIPSTEQLDMLAR